MSSSLFSVSRRQLIGGAVLAGAAPRLAAAQQSITRLIVGFPPGGPLDTAARVVAGPLTEHLGRTVVVENQPGAGSLIAAQNVARARPDGSHILLAPVVVPAFFPAIYPKLQFDPLEDLLPVGLLGDFSFALAVSTKVPATNLTEFVAYLKANAGKTSFGSLSAGTPSHFLGVIFNRAAGTDMLHVPYKGGAPVLTALQAGEIDAGFVVSGEVASLHKAGRLRVLGVTGRARSARLPEVPLLSEELPSMAEMDRASLWYGFFVPKGTDAASAERTNQAIVATLKLPKVREQLGLLDLHHEYPTAAEFSERVRRDAAYWGQIIQSTGFKLES